MALSSSKFAATGASAGEPTDEADRGRHPGFARHECIAGGPGSLSLSFAGLVSEGLSFAGFG